MAKRECDSCSEAPAIIRLSATDQEGMLLDSTDLCRKCAEGALRNTGLEVGSLAKLETA
jgi:hypothetical protein